MGLDIVRGAAYLTLLDETKIAKYMLWRLLEATNMTYIEELNAFMLCDRTQIKRYREIALYEPIGWTFSSSCNKLDVYFLEETDKTKLDTFLTKCREEGYLVKTHGWYEISYLSR
jgi:hypothetical protein